MNRSDHHVVARPRNEFLWLRRGLVIAFILALLALVCCEFWIPQAGRSKLVAEIEQDLPVNSHRESVEIWLN
jgi:hypothetical protein